VFVAMTALAPAVVAGGCDDEPDARVAIAVDGSAKGDPRLLGGPASDAQQQRVAITPDGVPTAVYAVHLDGLAAGDDIRALSTVTVTKCQQTDYDPRQRSHTGCQYTKHYDYNPVETETRFRLVGDDGGAPDLAGGGVELGTPNEVSCTNLKHHCTVINIAEEELEDAAIDDDLEWVVLEMSATSPQASSCEPRRAADCEVLAVEVQKGTAMYVVDVRGDPPQPDDLPGDRSENGSQIPVVDDEVEGNSRQAGRQVVYSIPLSSKREIKGLLGDQFVVGALLRVGSETRAYSPLVTSYLVLASRSDGVTGRYLVSDSYSPERTGNTGENCSGKCAYVRGAAATTILPCDVRAGRRFVNLVAGAARDVAPPGRTVRILDGGMRIVRYYESDVSAGSGGRC
jgi:hypothetical protein